MRRALAVAAVLAAGLAIARAPLIRPSPGGALLAAAREVAVYRLGPGPARFSLPPGQRSFRLLLNLDLAPDAPVEGIPYAVRVEIPEDAFGATFALLATPARDPRGAPAAFYLGEALAPSRTREVAVERARDGAATAVVSLASPAGATASVRLLTLEARPPFARDVLLGRLGAEGRVRLAASLGPLDWDHLGEPARQDLLARRWVRAAAEAGSPARRLYLLGSPAPTREPRLPGEEVGAGRAAAFTVRGPGTLHLLAAAGPLQGEARLLAAGGASTAVPLDLGPGERASLPIGPELATVRVSAGVPSRVQAVGDPGMAVDPLRARGLPDGEAVLEPLWSVESVPLAQPEPAPPLAWDLAGRGGAEVRLSARVLLGSANEETPFRLRWRALDGRGEALAGGEILLSARPAPEDRVDGEPFLVPAQPAYAYLWPPSSAERLEIRADRAVALGLSSPGFAPDPFAGPRPGFAASVVQRFHREERPAWFRVRPLDEAGLEAAGRLVRLRSAVRLEQVPEPPPVPPEAESFEPTGGPPRLLLLAPAPPGAAPRDRGCWWPFPAGAEIPVRLAPPPGSPPGARVQPTLLYAGEAGLAGREALVVVDGRPVARLPIVSSRGLAALPFLSPGTRRLRVDPGAPARLFLDRPVEGSPFYRAHGVYEISDGAVLRVRLPKGSGSRSLGVALYFDGRPSPQARLEARIDGGRRRPRTGTASTGWTRLERLSPLRAEPAPGALYLNRAGATIWASAPVFVPLHDDLRPGVHEIAVALRGAGARAFARFFGYGADGPAERVGHFSEIHTESPP